MSEKQTLLQQSREKLNNSVPKFLQTEVSMKGMRNLAVAGLVSSAAIFGGEKINKIIPLTPDQITIASSTLEKVDLGPPSQFSKALKIHSKGATTEQISKYRADLISSNPELSKEISDDLMERFNSNPNTENMVALFQSLGEQNPKLKTKFDQAIRELGQDPDSKPIDPKYLSALIASISGGLLVLKTGKEIKSKIEDLKRPITKIDEVIPNREQSQAARYYNNLGQKITIVDKTLPDIDQEFSISQIEKVANETPRFQERVNSLKRLEGQDKVTKDFVVEVITNLGVSYKTLKEGDIRKRQIKAFVDSIVKYYEQKCIKNEKFTPQKLEDKLIESLGDKTIPPIVKIAFNSAKNLIK
jgi:hypothetical protein